MQALRRGSAVCMRGVRSGLMPQRSASVASPAVFFGQVCSLRCRRLLPRSPQQACLALRLPLQQACPALRLPLVPSPAAAARLHWPPLAPLRPLFHLPPFVLLGQPACGLLVS